MGKKKQGRARNYSMILLNLIAIKRDEETPREDNGVKHGTLVNQFAQTFFSPKE
jgi:hypothetical protein